MTQVLRRVVAEKVVRVARSDFEKSSRKIRISKEHNFSDVICARKVPFSQMLATVARERLQQNIAFF